MDSLQAKLDHLWLHPIEGGVVGELEDALSGELSQGVVPQIKVGAAQVLAEPEVNGYVHAAVQRPALCSLGDLRERHQGQRKDHPRLAGYLM
jgi:hypothetical protein